MPGSKHIYLGLYASEDEAAKVWPAAICSLQSCKHAWGLHEAPSSAPTRMCPVDIVHTPCRAAGVCAEC